MTYEPTEFGSGTLTARPDPTLLPAGYLYFATDDYGGTLYRVTAGAPQVWQQQAPGLYSRQSVPMLGSRFQVFGHSWVSGGADPLGRSWPNMLAGMLRAKVWNTSVGGAVLPTIVGKTAGGYGGIAQIMQTLVPNPSQAVRWRGAYSATAWYQMDEGVLWSGNWYHWSYWGPVNNITPAGSSNWTQVTGPRSQGAGNYLTANNIPIFWYGVHEQGGTYNKNIQPFLSALEAALAEACSAYIYGWNDSMITHSVAPSVIAYGAFPYGYGVDIGQFQGAGTTVSFTTPPDFPGGYVDFFFVTIAGLWSGAAGTSTMAFQVDNVNTNVVSSGTMGSNVVDFGNGPDRRITPGSALTSALASGTPYTSIPIAGTSAFGASTIPAASNVYVGSGATQETFVTSGVVDLTVNNTSIPVNSRAATYNHPIGEPVGFPSNALNTHWVVRVPVTPGSHTVKGTVGGSAPTNMFFDHLSMESPSPGPIFVGGISKMISRPSFHCTCPTDADVDTWNTQIAAMCGAGNEFPSAVFVDLAYAVRPGTKLTAGLSAGQTGINSLSVQPLPYAINSGDTIIIDGGESLFGDTATASGPAAVGATSIPVNSFTSTYAHAIGREVYNKSYVLTNMFGDGMHPNDQGHARIAAMFYAAMANVTLTPQQLASESDEAGEITVTQVITQGMLTVGVSNAFGWGRVTGTTNPQLTIAADPGDILEVCIHDGVWDGNAWPGRLDIATLEPGSNAVINYFSSILSFELSANNALGARQGGGLPSLSAAVAYLGIVGTFLYPVQVADVKGGSVTLALWGSSDSATNRQIYGTPGNHFTWSVKRKRPISWTGYS